MFPPYDLVVNWNFVTFLTGTAKFLLIMYLILLTMQYFSVPMLLTQLCLFMNIVYHLCINNCMFTYLISGVHCSNPQFWHLRKSALTFSGSVSTYHIGRLKYPCKAISGERSEKPSVEQVKNSSFAKFWTMLMLQQPLLVKKLFGPLIHMRDNLVQMHKRKEGTSNLLHHQMFGVAFFSTSKKKFWLEFGFNSVKKSFPNYSKSITCNIIHVLI